MLSLITVSSKISTGRVEVFVRVNPRFFPEMSSWKLHLSVKVTVSENEDEGV